MATPSGPGPDGRLAREAAFHDHAFAEHVRSEADRFYEVTGASMDHYRRLILDGVSGRRVLEYGCGTGSEAFEIARRGGRAVGIDISPVAIQMAQKTSAEQGLASGLDFLVMNAESLAFPSESFDVVCGSGILHHLDLARSLAEIARVLKPGGRGVFKEPLGHNPLINWYRSRTPHLRTEDEHPLLRQDLALARRSFPAVGVFRYHLSSLSVVPLRRTRLFRPALAATQALDRALLSTVSPLRDWAWIVVLVLSK